MIANSTHYTCSCLLLEELLNITLNPRTSSGGFPAPLPIKIKTVTNGLERKNLQYKQPNYKNKKFFFFFLNRKVNNINKQMKKLNKFTIIFMSKNIISIPPLGSLDITMPL